MSRAQELTVDFRAIEIDLQEAVSRFLNVTGKSGLSQSISKGVHEKFSDQMSVHSIDWLPDCAR